MRTPESIAAEAVACKQAGDDHGYGEQLRILESYGFTELERALLMQGKSLDEVLGLVPPRKAALTRCD